MKWGKIFAPRLYGQIVLTGIAVLLLSGCADPIGDLSERLKEGMTRNQVDMLFGDEEMVQFSHSKPSMRYNTKTFSTNAPAYWIRYAPDNKFLSPPVSCTVYFDDEDVIVGYELSRPS